MKKIMVKMEGGYPKRCGVDKIKEVRLSLDNLCTVTLFDGSKGTISKNMFRRIKRFNPNAKITNTLALRIKKTHDWLKTRGEEKSEYENLPEWFVNQK